MRLSSWWVPLTVIIGSVLVVSCRPAPSTTTGKNEPPARVENTDAPDIKRVVLTEKAAERLGITTSLVVEQYLLRTRAVGGEVIALESGDIMVRVHATPNDLARVDRSQAARVQRLVPRNAATQAALTFGPLSAVARAAEPPLAVAKDGPRLALYYTVDNANQNFKDGERVLIELALAGGQPLRKLVPYSALLYDLRGDTWTYVRSAPLTFVRQPVMLDYIDGDTAVLVDGPAAGSEVVNVGATELFGTEFKVGK
jgi:hypothetical protein